MRHYDVNGIDGQKNVYIFNKRSAETALENDMKDMNMPALLLRPGIILVPHASTMIGRRRLTWWFRSSTVRGPDFGTRSKRDGA